MSSRAMSGPLRSLRSSRSTSSSRLLSSSTRARTVGASVADVSGRGGRSAARSRRACSAAGPCRAAVSQESGHRRALVEEDPDVALGRGSGQRLIQCGRGRRGVAGRLVGERLQDEDLDLAPAALPVLGSVPRSRSSSAMASCRARPSGSWTCSASSSLARVRCSYSREVAELVVGGEPRLGRPPARRRRDRRAPRAPGP